MEQVTQQSSQDIGCPRCAYDLSGEMRSWESQCPLNGVCPECGMKIRWGSMFANDYGDPNRFFETSNATPRSAFLETFRRAKNPYRFWKWVKIDYDFNWNRMLLLSAGGMLALHILLTLSAVVVCLIIHSIGVANAPAYMNHQPMVKETFIYTAKIVGNPIIFDPGQRSDEYSLLIGARVWILMGTLTMTAMPATFLLLPVTLSHMKQRTGHLVRVMSYSIIWLPLMWFIFTGSTALYTIVYSNQFLFGRHPVRGGYLRSSAHGPLPYLLDMSDALVSALYNYDCEITIVVAYGWGIVWWWCAGKYYLKIPRPLLVSVLFMILSTLAVMVLLLPIVGLDALNRLFPT